MNTSENMHIGKLVRKQLYENGQTVVWLAKQFGCDRSKLYRIFSNSDIYCSDLWKISIIMKHNFFNDLSEHFKQTMQANGKNMYF